ncbi:MAG: type III pantothenate kinase, partial [Ginsengibacter sp.]
MSETLCLDFGNTRKKAAIFHKSKMKESVALGDDSVTSIQTILDKFHPKKSILSSVINHNPAIEELLAAQTQFHKLNHLSKLPFTVPVGKPETMGADRLA